MLRNILLSVDEALDKTKVSSNITVEKKQHLSVAGDKYSIDVFFYSDEYIYFVFIYLFCE